MLTTAHPCLEKKADSATGREAWPGDHDHCASVVGGRSDFTRCHEGHFAEAPDNKDRHNEMCRRRRPIIECPFAPCGPISELVTNNESARCILRLQRTDGARPDDAGGSKLFHTPDVGPKRHEVRRELIVGTVTRKEGGPQPRRPCRSCRTLPAGHRESRRLPSGHHRGTRRTPTRRTHQSLCPQERDAPMVSGRSLAQTDVPAPSLPFAPL